MLKLGKTYNGTRSLFSVIVLIVMSVACETFLGFEFFTRFKISFRETNLKLNFWLFILIILFLINVTLRWPLYFSNASFTGSAKSYTDGSLMEGFSGNDKFLAMFKKKFEFPCNLYMSRYSNSLSIKFIVFCIIFVSEKKGFTVCQKILWIFISAIYSLSVFLNRLTQ